MRFIDQRANVQCGIRAAERARKERRKYEGNRTVSVNGLRRLKKIREEKDRDLKR